MDIANYISDLLYRYECVIIPDFGGFVTNVKSAQLNLKNNTFYPPFKALTFNANLVQNDGLLANYIAKAEGYSYQQATDFIKESVLLWRRDLKNKVTIDLDKIGSLSLNAQGQIIFEPQVNINYLTTSYGLSSVIATQILKTNSKPVIHLNNQPRTFLKYAAIFVIGLSTIGVISNKLYQDYRVNKQNQLAQAQQNAIQNKIQVATFIISNPLPSITLKNTYTPKNFHVVAGAFRDPANAVKKLDELKSLGFDAAIIGVNKWQLTQVVYGSFALKEEADALLRKLRASQNEDAWLLIQNQ